MRSPELSTRDVVVSARPGCLTLLGGPPGSGKSTVADALASSAGRPTVHLHTDSLYTWIRSGFVLPYLPEARRQNEVVQKVMIDAACAYADGGYDVVLDGILGPWLLDAFRAACGKRELDLSYVVLRPSLEVTLSRASQREDRQLKDVEPIVGLYGAFENLGPLEGHVIDSTAQSVEETRVEVVDGLRVGRFAAR
ncbi:AAA family ATPase [Streptomyces sp. NPDC005728]|uniref:AAA family ATPase n=1 Tax=Streptomyces sp. NPDC005728 TaxID=3157054 RepID=UPI0033D862CF